MGKRSSTNQSSLTSISLYGLICNHFTIENTCYHVGTFYMGILPLKSLDGRGYWQELIESIIWAHHKLKIINNIQPRALSISQGRAVGLIHYTLGGVGLQLYISFMHT